MMYNNVYVHRVPSELATLNELLYYCFESV